MGVDTRRPESHRRLQSRVQEDDNSSASLSKPSRSRWSFSLKQTCGLLEQVVNWTWKSGIDCLMNRTDTNRFEFSLHFWEEIKYLRVLQGHSGGTRVDPKLQNHELVPDGWTDLFLPRGIFVGCSVHHRGGSHHWGERIFCKRPPL